MPRTLDNRRHEALRAFLVKRRKQAGLRQIGLAKRLNRSRSYITEIESGQRRVGLLELMDLAEVLGFGAEEAIEHLAKLK
jgi:transcriptional regulator with XRE-family HTH domain